MIYWLGETNPISLEDFLASEPTDLWDPEGLLETVKVHGVAYVWECPYNADVNNSRVILHHYDAEMAQNQRYEDGQDI